MMSLNSYVTEELYVDNNIHKEEENIPEIFLNISGIKGYLKGEIKSHSELDTIVDEMIVAVVSNKIMPNENLAYDYVAMLNGSIK